MRLSVKAMTITSAALWAGLGMFLPGLMNLAFPPYGEHYLLTLSSIYPGYHASGTFLDLLAGTGYAIFDGALFGLVFAWVYNLVAGREKAEA